MAMKIRDRSGAVREVDDGYILRDGEAFVIPLNMMDSRMVSVIRDASGSPAGTRPGYLLADNDQSDLDQAHREYRAAIERRWQSNRWQDQPSRDQTVEREAQPATSPLANPETALAEAYAQYEADVQQRWRRQW
jgi:hypothetical protein